jgi:hypothetical protein
MRWVGDKFRRRLQVAGFLVLLFGVAAFLVVTDNDEGPSLWQRWTKSRSVSADSNRGVLLRQISSIDVPGPKGKRFDYFND